MKNPELSLWFEDIKNRLETVYLQNHEPWKQSGFSGPEARWVIDRQPVADCIEEAGNFLDIGCANGYLLECVMRWVAARGLKIIPYGLDLSDKLVKLAQLRLPGYKGNFFTGNGWDWDSPVKFKYVRTELVYVPEHLQPAYMQRVLDEYLEDGGYLLVAGYTSRTHPEIKIDIDEKLKAWGFRVIRTVSGFWDGYEESRVAVVKRPI